MNNIEFIDYKEAKTDYQMGIATIKLYGRIVLRYKIVAKKDGTGYFPACASYKISEMGEDTFLKAFVVDSRSEEEEIENCIRSNIKRILSQGYQSKPQENTFQTQRYENSNATKKDVRYEDGEIPF